MDKITLADLGTWAGALAILIGSCGTIYAFLQKGLKNLFKTHTQDIHKEMEKHEASINRVDMENCKNFLVQFLARAERGDDIGEIEKERFWEQYEHYLELGGNSYIRNRVEQLRKDGKL